MLVELRSFLGHHDCLHYVDDRVAFFKVDFSRLEEQSLGIGPKALVAFYEERPVVASMSSRSPAQHLQDCLPVQGFFVKDHDVSVLSKFYVYTDTVLCGQEDDAELLREHVVPCSVARMQVVDDSGRGVELVVLQYR